MPTVKSYGLAFLSALTISSAQLDRRHPKHDLYARTESEFGDLNVRDPMFGSRIVKDVFGGAKAANTANNDYQQIQSNQIQRRRAQPDWETEALYARDPMFGSRIIKGIVRAAKGAENGANTAQNFQSSGPNRRRSAEAEPEPEAEADAEADAEAEEIRQREAEWNDGLYTRDAYSEADWQPLFW